MSRIGNYTRLTPASSVLKEMTIHKIYTYYNVAYTLKECGFLLVCV